MTLLSPLSKAGNYDKKNVYSVEQTQKFRFVSFRKIPCDFGFCIVKLYFEISFRFVIISTKNSAYRFVSYHHEKKS